MTLESIALSEESQSQTQIPRVCLTCGCYCRNTTGTGVDPTPCGPNVVCNPRSWGWGGARSTPAPFIERARRGLCPRLRPKVRSLYTNGHLTATARGAAPACELWRLWPQPWGLCWLWAAGGAEPWCRELQERLVSARRWLGPGGDSMQGSGGRRWVERERERAPPPAGPLPRCLQSPGLGQAEDPRRGPPGPRFCGPALFAAALHMGASRGQPIQRPD